MALLACQAYKDSNAGFESRIGEEILHAIYIHTKQALILNFWRILPFFCFIYLKLKRASDNAFFQLLISAILETNN